MFSTRSLVASLLVVVVLTGCLSAPVDRSPSDRVASYSLSNEGDERYLVTISLVPELDGFVLTFVNGSTTRYPTASSVDALPSQAVERAISVVPLGASVETFAHRLGPNEGVGSTVESLPRDAVIVYTVAQPLRDVPMRTVGVSSCGAGTTDSTFELRIYPDGNIDSATLCRG